MKDTGGPAFPHNELINLDGVILRSGGMTLRDYFAAKAMQGMLSNPKLATHILKIGGAYSGWIEESAYSWADAMLVARRQQ